MNQDAIVVLIWNVAALVALALALVGLGGALADWEYLRERRINGLRSLQAGTNLRTHATRATVSLLFLLIGALVLIESPWRGDASRWMLIAASVLMALGAVADWIDRRRAIRIVIEEGKAP